MYFFGLRPCEIDDEARFHVYFLFVLLYLVETENLGIFILKFLGIFIAFSVVMRKLCNIVFAVLKSNQPYKIILPD